MEGIYGLEPEIWTEDLSKKLFELQDQYVVALEPNQRASIVEFRSRVHDVLKPNHTDFFLLKWLRARNFDLNAAESMLRSSLKWRQQTRVDMMHEEFNPPEVLMKFFPQSLGGEDKGGMPLLIFPLGRLDVRGMLASVTKSDVVEYTILLLELVDRVKKRQSIKHDKLLDNMTCVFDAEGFSMRDFTHKTVLDVFVTIFKIFEANYPESLKKAYVINAPKVFLLFWTMIKRFLSEPTRKKITIDGKESWKSELLKDIEADQLPQHWGGNLVGKTDNNPYGNVIMGGIIPDSYIISLSKKAVHDEDIKTVMVANKANYVMELHVDQPGSTLSWEFQTEQHDVGFGIEFKHTETDRKSTLLQVERYNYQTYPNSGTIDCEKAGTYALVFDNTFSWYRSKKVHFKVELIDAVQVKSMDRTIGNNCISVM